MLRCFDLPEDVVVKILCWLPVKSLIRFTSVSKRWRSVIFDPQFVKSHLQLTGTLNRRILVLAYCFDFKSLGLANGDLPTRFKSYGDDSSVITLTYPTDPNLNPKILSSCHGLVLLAVSTASHGKSLYVWNPSTRFSCKISHLPFEDVHYASIGHDSATDDYKVVLIPHLFTDEAGSSGHVYSLREKIWKVVEIPPWLELSSWATLSGTLSNGAMHWVLYFIPEITERVIYAFDLEKEVFRRVPLPKLIQNEVDMDTITIRTQVYLGGCLCISSVDAYENIEYWIMTEYGAPESWVKLFKFSLSDLPKVPAGLDSSCTPIFVSEGGTVLMRVADKMEFLKMEFSKEGKLCSSEYQLEEEMDGCENIYLATVYDETLVSIPE